MKRPSSYDYLFMDLTSILKLNFDFSVLLVVLAMQVLIVQMLEQSTELISLHPYLILPKKKVALVGHLVLHQMTSTMLYVIPSKLIFIYSNVF